MISFAVVGNYSAGVNVSMRNGWKRRKIEAMYMQMVQDDRKTRLDEQIDENLRRVYRERLVEDIPERFQDLLRQLKERDRPE